MSEVLYDVGLLVAKVATKVRNTWSWDAKLNRRHCPNLSSTGILLSHTRFVAVILSIRRDFPATGALCGAPVSTIHGCMHAPDTWHAFFAPSRHDSGLQQTHMDSSIRVGNAFARTTAANLHLNDENADFPGLSALDSLVWGNSLQWQNR